MAKRKSDQIAFASLAISILSCVFAGYQWWSAGRAERIRAAVEVSRKYLDEWVEASRIVRAVEQGTAARNERYQQALNQYARLDYIAYMANHGLLNTNYLPRAVVCNIIEMVEELKGIHVHVSAAEAEEFGRHRDCSAEDEAIRLHPKDPDAYDNRGLAYAAKGDYDRAIADFNVAIRLNLKASNPYKAFNHRGLAYYANGDNDRAIADYNEAIRFKPKDPKPYNNRGLAYYTKGNSDRAIADYNEAIRLNPKEASAYDNLGNVYKDRDDLDRAIADYSEAIRLDPKFAVAYNDRGVAYDDKGDHDRAIADYSEAIRLKPKDPKPYINRGIAYYANGDNDRAIADYTEAIRLDPKEANAYDNRGDAYKAKGELDRAIADYSEAIRLDPKFAVAYDNRGDAYKAKGELDRAIADYSNAIRLDPKYAVAYRDRGLAYAAKGDPGRAIADYSEAIRLDPKDADAYRGRGRAYLYSGNLAKAWVDVSQASELDPKDAYSALWVDIVGQRNNVPSRLSQVVSKIDMAEWPAPVIRMFLGEMTPTAVLAAADDPDAGTKKGQVCEASLYSGELALRQGVRDEAARLFQLAAKDCEKYSDDWLAANQEFKALGEAP
jgi:tetratricopeptide (TPR) repeat protein